MAEEKTKLMETLVDELNRASDAYYNGESELMSDFEWDSRFDQLKQLEEETGTVLADSPTQKVSADNVSGKKEEHEFPALSLAKTKDSQELVKWAEEKPVWISWKLDGLTLVVTYDNGKLTKVVTRGNGHVGTNITRLASAIGGILKSIPSKSHVVIRGEAVISYEDFEKFNLESNLEFANPRNLAAGSLTLKNVNEVKERHIFWMPFTLVYTDEDIVSWGERLDWLESQGFKPVRRRRINHPTLSNIQREIALWTEEVTARRNPYPVDGLVIAYDDTAFAATGSITGHHATRAGLAFKWQDESAETELEYIDWSCGALTISPVAVFKPVELEGTVVKRASLCNISECERLGIGGKGSAISVIKANKIIPKVIKVNAPVGELEIPHHCPVCGSETKIHTSEISETKTLQCTNQDCPAKELKKFVRFVSKQGMDIDGISEQTLAKFINLGWVKEYADLYNIKNHQEELRVLEGFGDKSTRNILNSIEKSRNVDARNFLFSLTIPLCGIDVCKRLLSAYPMEELIKHAVTTDEPEFFATIPGIGPEKSSSFITWFQNPKNKGRVDRLLPELNVEQHAKTETSGRYNGLTFVITGNVFRFKNRTELRNFIESQGGKVTGSVSNSTDYLINNDMESTSGKNKKAKELHIPIISENTFLEKFGANNGGNNAEEKEKDLFSI